MQNGGAEEKENIFVFHSGRQKYDKRNRIANCD
jgi:hypothetical protein